jgi:hypothetical protein
MMKNIYGDFQCPLRDARFCESLPATLWLANFHRSFRTIKRRMGNILEAAFSPC